MHDSKTLPSNVTEYTVSEISFALKRSIEDTFSFVRIRGELGRVSRPASGHVYLDLKDEKAVISGVIWKGVASGLQIQPEQGLEVIATGRMTTFPGQSRYQIVIESLEPAGLGALMALLEDRKKKLAAEGLFDQERKQTIPYLPRMIGVVTSPSGAVIRDIMHRLRDRFPSHVLVWPVRVQGEKSADEVTAAIHGFNSIEPEGPVPRPDLIIVARGGGSLEDLWSFNEERVARAASESEIPLISAVGHETDWTLIDYVADERAPTPTAAAERAVPVRSELLSSIDDQKRRLRLALTRLLETRRAVLRGAQRGLPRLADLVSLPRQRLDFASASLVRALRSSVKDRRARLENRSAGIRPHLLVAQLRDRRFQTQQFYVALKRVLGEKVWGHRSRLDRVSTRVTPQGLTTRARIARQSLLVASNRLSPAFAARTLRYRERLTSLSSLMDAYSYQGVLARGFALVRDKESQPLRSVEAARSAKTLEIQFADGRLAATVADGKEAENAGQSTRPRGARPKRPSNTPATKGQASLFDEE